jgi:hypothetical protein
MEEKGHVLKILKRLEIALKNKDYVEIKNLSNKLLHNCSINQDPDCISLTVIIYSLSKMIERENYKTYKQWSVFYQKYIQEIDGAITALKKNNIAKFREKIEAIRQLIQDISGGLKWHMQEVFRKAKINKASRIYEHGISMEKTAKILGISVWELAEYAGQTGIGDINLGITLPIGDRIKQAEEMFKK